MGGSISDPYATGAGTESEAHGLTAATSERDPAATVERDPAATIDGAKPHERRTYEPCAGCPGPADGGTPVRGTGLVRCRRTRWACEADAPSRQCRWRRIRLGASSADGERLHRRAPSETKRTRRRNCSWWRRSGLESHPRKPTEAERRRPAIGFTLMWRRHWSKMEERSRAMSVRVRSSAHLYKEIIGGNIGGRI
jgi:hypothetical protein